MRIDGNTGVRPALRTLLAWCGFLSLLGAIAGANGPARADEDTEQAAVNRVAPRAEARIGDQELVMTYLEGIPGEPNSGKLIVYLQRYVDGVPTTGAKIDVTIDFMSETLSEIGPGVYSTVSLPIASGRNDIQLTYKLGDKEGTASFPLMVASTDGSTPSAALPPVTNRNVPGFVLAIFAAVIFVGVNGLLLRRTRRA
jgi:hypothetical protein